jgi:hypothetical protein
MKLIPLKQWIVEEAEKAKVKTGQVRMHLSRTNYFGLKLHRINARVIYVEV